MMFGAAVEETRPKGVFWAGVLTVLGALGLWFLAGFTFVFGLTPGSSVSQLWVIGYGGLAGGLGALLLLDAILVFRGMRIGYFLSMVLWFLTFAAAVWWAAHAILLASNLLSVLPIIYYALYTVVCFALFLRSNVRTYFGT
jgi:hypothetical protein